MTDTAAENGSALAGIVTELGVLRLAISTAGRGRNAPAQGAEATTLYTRALSLGALLAPHLAASKLPLPRDLHQLAADCMQTLGELAVPPKVIDHAADSNRPEHALNLLREQLALAYLSGAGAPPGLWAAAHALFASSREKPDDEAQKAANAYKSLLALATARPESLTGQETLWTARHLADYARLASLRDTPPPEDEAGWFWLDPATDQPPAAISLKKPPVGVNLRYFSPAPMASAMTAGSTGQDSTPALTETGNQQPPAILSLLRRLRERWTLPARREQPRRSNRYAVQVCTGLDAIWAMLREPDPQAQAKLTTEWMVLNESASGYAIMHLAGTAGSLAAGMVLALRRPSEKKWTLCLARWLRTDSPNRVELGLQVLSQDAQPVSIGFNPVRHGGHMRNALILPPVAALRRHAAILAPAGSYTGRHFVLVAESDHLYVAQGQLLGLDIQTESIELFQFEIDQYAH